MVMLLALLAALVLDAPSPSGQSAVHERRVTLTGLTNLRDLGGYTTSDSKRVRWGLVYRSDQLAQLTDEGFAELAQRGITTICDLRRDDERRRAPTQWRGSVAPEILLRLPPPPTDQTVPDPVGAATRGGNADEVAATMRASYASNVTALAATYGMIFRRILDGQRVLVHCTAGKDRTGIFSALFLRLVGVPTEAVEQDYLLSNTYYGTDERVAGLARSLKTSPDSARALLGVDVSYLRAAFQEIDQRYTSIDNYRRTMLGLSDDDLKQLKERVLEP